MFYLFQGTFIEANKIIFLEGESQTLKESKDLKSVKIKVQPY